MTQKASETLAVEGAIRTLLAHFGEDPDRDGLLETPSRVVRAFIEMTAGYRLDPATILGKRFEKGAYDQVIILRGVEYTSLCEHHLMTFDGVAALAYLPGPDGRIVGLSKLARLVHCFARRLQVQERLTAQIGIALEEHLGAAGVAVILDGHHHCMSSRGVRCRGTMTTSFMGGLFRSDSAARSEVLALIRA